MGFLNLLVLRCSDLERSRAFYEIFGHLFVKHAHGDGPEHYAAEGRDGVFELYPAGPDTAGDQTGLGFAVASLETTWQRFTDLGFNPKPVSDKAWGRSFVVRDPDGRRVEVSLARQARKPGFVPSDGSVDRASIDAEYAAAWQAEIRDRLRQSDHGDGRM